MTRDLFGVEIDERSYPDVMPIQKKRDYSAKGFPARPGSGPAGETCRSCANCVRCPYHGKNYYKCAILRHRWTSGPGTDIKLKSPACEWWKAKAESGGA